MAAYPGAIPTFSGFTAGHTLVADSHASQHNLEQAEIVAIATKVGTGASTPSSGKVLRSTGAGVSSWGQVDQTTDITGITPIANGGTGQNSLSNLPLTAPVITGNVTGGATYTSPTLITPNVDTVNESTSANGITIDSLNIKDGKLNTNDSVVTNNLTNSAVINEKIDVLTQTGIITGSGTLTASYASYGTDLNLNIPTGCTKALILGSVRMSNTGGVLADFSVKILYESTTSSNVVTVTNTTNFHGCTVPIISVMDVTAGTRNFRVQAVRSASTGTISAISVNVVPLAG